MKFIRIDAKGTWKGTEHCSSIANLGEETNESVQEEGISCYRIYEDDEVQAIENLYEYWYNFASLKEIADYTDMQITIFEGEKLTKWGADSEDLALCTRTLKEIDALEFMTKLMNIKDLQLGLGEEDITEKEYNKLMNEFAGEYIE